eukprot:Nk52_evm10s316 gene=Nk52_evmTU10s316
MGVYYGPGLLKIIRAGTWDDKCRILVQFAESEVFGTISSEALFYEVFCADDEEDEEESWRNSKEDMFLDEGDGATGRRKVVIKVSRQYDHTTRKAKAYLELLDRKQGEPIMQMWKSICGYCPRSMTEFFPCEELHIPIEAAEFFDGWKVMGKQVSTISKTYENMEDCVSYLESMLKSQNESNESPSEDQVDEDDIGRYEEVLDQLDRCKEYSFIWTIAW